MLLLHSQPIPREMFFLSISGVSRLAQIIDISVIAFAFSYGIGYL